MGIVKAGDQCQSMAINQPRGPLAEGKDIVITPHGRNAFTGHGYGLCPWLPWVHGKDVGVVQYEGYVVGHCSSVVSQGSRWYGRGPSYARMEPEPLAAKR